VARPALCTPAKIAGRLREDDLATECDEVVDIAPFVAERADESTSSRMLIRTGSVTSLGTCRRTALGE
jgi:hypothetical protein